jgi:hypothetical protein
MARLAGPTSPLAERIRPTAVRELHFVPYGSLGVGALAALSAGTRGKIVLTIG